MTLPLREGLHRGVISSAGLGEAKTGTLQFGANIDLLEYYDNASAQWCDVTEERTSITAYMTITLKNGDLNEISIRELKDSLMWDGRDIEALNNNNWSGFLVQVLVADDIYNGVTKKKVKSLRHTDANPVVEVKKIPSDKLKAIADALNSKLRAIATPVAAPAPPKPASRPAPPPPPADDIDFLGPEAKT